MIKFGGVLLAVAIVTPAAAQVEVPPGMPVRIVAPAFGPEPVITRLVRMAGDSLVIQSRSWLPELAVAPGDITRLEVGSGRTNRRRSLIGVGIGTGFGAGALLGLSVGSYLVNRDLAHGSNEFGRLLVGGLIGAGVGAIVGAVVGTASSEPSWQLVDQREVRIVARPTFGAGVGLAFRLTKRR